MAVRGENRHWLWVLVAILLLAFGLRLYRLGAESLWYDETVSVHLAGKSVPALVAHTAGDIHPPGYYLLLNAWLRLAGSSEFAVAFPSLFFGMLLVALVYWLGAQVFGRKAGLLAAFLLAISPFNIWYSQEVRMYTLGALLGMGVLCAALFLLSAPASPGTRRLKLLAIYVVSGALGLWTLYYFAFLLLAINLMVVLWWFVAAKHRRVGWAWLAHWALAQVAVLLLFAPWIPVAWRQATQPPVPPWRGFTALGGLLAETWSALCLGQSVEPQQVWPVLLLFGGLFGLGLFSTRLRPRLQGAPRAGNAPPWFLAGYLFIPVFLIYLASLVTPLYHVRYVFTYSPPFYMLSGAGIAWLWQRWRPVAWLSLAAIVIFSVTSLYAYHTDPHYASDDHRSASNFLAERWQPGDAILVNAGYAYTALMAYWDGDSIAWQGRLVEDELSSWEENVGRGPVVVQTGTVDGDSSLGWGDPNSDFYSMSRAETAEALDRLFAAFDRVFVYRIYDTVTDPDGFIRRWLDENGIRFEDQVFTGESRLRVQGFLTGRDPLEGMEQPVEAGLADGSLRLVGSTVLPSAAEVGGSLEFALAWEAASQPSDMILFAGLFDEMGRRWAQTDERSVGSLYSLQSWPQGATVRTPLRIQLPPDTPPGRYRLELGWYRFVDAQPVWQPWASGERSLLGEVDLLPPGDWTAMPEPMVAHPVNVMMGEGVQFVGFDAPTWEAFPGESLDLDLVWRVRMDDPEPGTVVLQLRDDSGQVFGEISSAPVGGRVPFRGLAAGQTVRDPRSFQLPGELPPGVYNLILGRRRADGTWLPIMRGPFPLGSTHPLATIRVMDRPTELTRPSVQNPVDIRFGESIGLVGYDLRADPPELHLTLYWQTVAPMTTQYKIFAHLLGAGGPADIKTQADLFPHLPTTAWIRGEYLQDDLKLQLPPDLPNGAYTLSVGIYDVSTGQRLSVLNRSGEALGDSLDLTQISHRK
jgi:4-amino-4-deoxy-L-arabinose transferase-like glycosyltransferase